MSTPHASPSADDGHSELVQALTRSKTLGFLGPGPVAGQLEHARGFVSVIADIGGDRVVDLGTGGGVPGLVLAVELPQVRFKFVERGRRRCEFLETAIAELGLADRVEIVESQAEEAARLATLDGWASAVTARSFGPPAVAAEAAVRFLAVGGYLVVSEPPDQAESISRWPSAGLGNLGLRFEGVRRVAASRLAVIEKVAPTPERVPRRAAASRKRPLF